MDGSVSLTNKTFSSLDILDDILPSVTETVGSYTFNEASALAQTMITLAITTRSWVNAIWLDMSNCTEDNTIRVYHQIDGVNYRLFQENFWSTVDDDGVLIDGFAAYRNIRITLQCDGTGLGNVAIPYTIL